MCCNVSQGLIYPSLGSSSYFEGGGFTLGGKKDTLTRLSLPSLLSSYEVQLESRVRRKGLGKFLIQILQLIANR